MALKRCTKLPRSSELKPQHQMRFNFIFRTVLFWWKRSYLSAQDTVSISIAPPTGRRLSNPRRIYKSQCQLKTTSTESRCWNNIDMSFQKKKVFGKRYCWYVIKVLIFFKSHYILEVLILLSIMFFFFFLSVILTLARSHFVSDWNCSQESPISFKGIWSQFFRAKDNSQWETRRKKINTPTSEPLYHVSLTKMFKRKKSGDFTHVWTKIVTVFFLTK